GTGAPCPTDVQKPNGPARTEDGNPWTTDTGNGASDTGQRPAGHAGTVCRPAAGTCDAAETCDGTSTGCPGDTFQPASTVCRAAAGACDLAETCTGSSAACPSDAKQASGTACADDGNPCTLDQCDGSSDTCQHPAGHA